MNWLRSLFFCRNSNWRQVFPITLIKVKSWNSHIENIDPLPYFMHNTYLLSCCVLHTLLHFLQSTENLKKNMQKLIENLASCQTNTRSQKRRLKYAFSPASIPQAIVNSNFPAWKIFSKIMATISNQFSSDQETMHNETFPKKDYITFLIVRILQNAQKKPKHIWSKQLNQMMRKELDFPPKWGR